MTAALIDRAFVRLPAGLVHYGTAPAVPVNDFSSVILQAQASGPQAIALATGGTDLQNAVRQAWEFGVQKKQKLAAMMMLGDFHGLGLKDGQGMTMPEAFYWHRRSIRGRDCAAACPAPRERFAYAPMAHRHRQGVLPPA